MKDKLLNEVRSVTDDAGKLTLEGTDVVCFHGDCGVLHKALLAELFCTWSAVTMSVPSLHGRPGETTDATVNLRLMVATAAATCGINCKYCRAVAVEGFPTDMTELVQMMGRAGRAPLATDAEVGNEFLVVVSVSMWSLLHLLLEVFVLVVHSQHLVIGSMCQRVCRGGVWQ